MRRYKAAFFAVFLIAFFSTCGKCDVSGAELNITSADSYIEDFLYNYPSIFTHIPYECIDDEFIFYDPVSGEIMDIVLSNLASHFGLYGFIDNDAPMILLSRGYGERASNDFALFKLVNEYYREVYGFPGPPDFYRDKNGRIVVCFPPGHQSFDGIYYLTISGDSVILDVIVDEKFYNHVTKQTDSSLDTYLYDNALTTIPGLPDEPLTAIDSLTDLEERITASVTQKLKDGGIIPRDKK
jgi:hypothetical protein